MLRHILVPVDFSVCARQVAQYAFDLARAIGGQITLLHVLEAQAPDDAHDLLRQLSALARVPPRCLVVPVSGPVLGGVAATVLKVAARQGSDLIVLGVRSPARRSPLGQVDSPLGQVDSPLGQVAVQVLLGALVPVQVVPCGQAAPTREGWRGLLAQDVPRIEPHSIEEQTPHSTDPRPRRTVMAR